MTRLPSLRLLIFTFKRRNMPNANARMARRAKEPSAVTVHYDRDGAVARVTIDRPEVANAIDRPTATALADHFRAFEADERLAVAVLTGAGGPVGARADLQARRTDPARAGRGAAGGRGRVGPTRVPAARPCR